MKLSPNQRRAVQQRLEGLLAAGVRQLPHAAPFSVPQPPASQPVPPQPDTPPAETPRPAPQFAPAAPPHVNQQPQPAAAGLPPVSGGSEAGTGPSTAPTLGVLRQQVAACIKCHELAGARTQTVFGVGDPTARLCFMGEAPGADEDQQGEPFVGRAGQLLNKIIQACGMQREEVYILNVLKCRPPGNRNPKPDEAANCSGFLNRQLELVDPEFICCLGAVAAQNLLQTQTAIGRLRGQVHDYRGIKVVCTYHPAYLLRNPSAKKDAWQDMKMLMGLMGVPL